MSNQTLSKRQAREQYGQRFVEIMMKGRDEITLSADQAVKARYWKMIQDKRFRPFDYDYVYVISDGSGRCKVGFSQTPKTRLASLQVASPDDLACEHIFVFRNGGGRNVEKAAHRMLKNNGAHLRNEWFALEGTVDAIRELVDRQYREAEIHLDAAWQGSEQMMAVTKFALKDDPVALAKVMEDRKQFLWVAALLRRGA